MIPLPCPFCGEAPEIGAEEDSWGPYVSTSYFIQCKAPLCSAAPLVIHDSAQEAMEAWNKRA